MHLKNMKTAIVGDRRMDELVNISRVNKILPIRFI